MNWPSAISIKTREAKAGYCQECLLDLMAGYPATLPAISLTAVQDKKGEGGNRKLSQDEGGFQYTIRAHCGYVIFMCGLSIIR